MVLFSISSGGLDKGRGHVFGDAHILKERMRVGDDQDLGCPEG